MQAFYSIFIDEQKFLVSRLLRTHLSKYRRTNNRIISSPLKLKPNNLFRVLDFKNVVLLCDFKILIAATFVVPNHKLMK